MAFIVRVSCPELSDAVKKIALKYGYKSYCNDLTAEDIVKGYALDFGFLGNSERIGRNSGEEWRQEQARDGIVIIDAATEFDKIEEQFKKEQKKTWKIGDYEGKFDKSKYVFKVGCVEVDFLTIREIYEEYLKIAKGSNF